MRKGKRPPTVVKGKRPPTGRKREATTHYDLGCSPQRGRARIDGTCDYISSVGLQLGKGPPTGPVTGVGHPLLPQLPDLTRASPPTTTSATSDGEIDEKGLSGDADGVTRELGCFCACALGRHAPRWRRQMTPRAARPRVTPPLTTNLHRPPQTRNPLTKPPGGSQQD